MIPIGCTSGALAHRVGGGTDQALNVKIGRAVGRDRPVYLQPAGLALGPFLPVQYAVLDHRDELKGVTERTVRVRTRQDRVPLTIKSVRSLIRQHRARLKSYRENGR